MPEKQPHFRFEQLCARHNRAEFSCGVLPLDNYLRKQARQDVDKKVAAVFVLTPDGKEIAGYYALSQFSMRLTSVPGDEAQRLPKYPDVPTTLLGRLAVSSAFQKRGLGELLLMDALKRSLEASKGIGSAAVVVDAKDESAKSFYKKFGFIELCEVANRLFLPMATIEKIFQ